MTARAKLKEPLQPLPDNTKRRDGLVLSTKRKGALVDRAERLRAQMYAEIEAHSGSEEEILARVKASRPKPEVRDKHYIAPSAIPKVARSSRKAKPGEIGEDTVTHPTLDGLTEKVVRVINTVDYMAARKQLDKRQIRVAEMLLNAHQVLYGSIGLNQDTTKVSGSGSPGSPPPPTYMIASERLREAKKYLFPPLYRIVVSVVIAGMTIEQVANEIAGGKATEHGRKDTGKKLRDGLTSLADRWLGEHEAQTSTHMRSWKTPDARPTESNVGTIKPGKTAHAARGRVFR